jgi:hypothetical protein
VFALVVMGIEMHIFFSAPFLIALRFEGFDLFLVGQLFPPA